MMFNYKWYKKELDNVEKNGLKVFSTFSCGGGSSFGYKMSGFDVVAANEIDATMAWHYLKNHNPKHYFKMPIQELLKKDMPIELYGIDILDGSPPCSTFSFNGKRESVWGKEKKFREGQEKQILSDLFFEFIKLAEIIRPKVIVAENVKGMIAGKAKGYVIDIVSKLKNIGYKTNVFLLNSKNMGLPQARERVFFISQLENKYKNIKLEFNEKEISIKEALKDITILEKDKKYLTPYMKSFWERCNKGKLLTSIAGKDKLFSYTKTDDDKPCCTITGQYSNIMHFNEPRIFTAQEIAILSSFPLDYVYKSKSLFGYLCGMSVPPVMMNRISDQVFKQIFNK